MKRISTLLFLCILLACNNTSDETPDDSTNVQAPPGLSYNIVKVYPHDTSSYTQGLIWSNNILYESTGREGFSKLKKLTLDGSGGSEEIKLSNTEFGEGIALFNNKIYQLTWRNNVVHVYDAATFKKVNDFKWPYEGWGITNNENELIISTGSSNLYFVTPENFSINKIVGVTNNYGPVANLNELEFINGFIYANVYGTNYILKINAETGKVEGQMDLSGLLAKSGMNYNAAFYELNTGNVLNGIAYDSVKKSMYITGKLWPALFEIKLQE